MLDSQKHSCNLDIKFLFFSILKISQANSMGQFRWGSGIPCIYSMVSLSFDPKPAYTVSVFFYVIRIRYSTLRIIVFLEAIFSESHTTKALEIERKIG